MRPRYQGVHLCTLRSLGPTLAQEKPIGGALASLVHYKEFHSSYRVLEHKRSHSGPKVMKK